jgi:hypothetical protein
MPGPKRKLRRSSAAVATSREGHRTSSFHPVWNGIGYVLSGATLLASQEENEWPREDETNPFAQPERTGIVCVHQKSQRQADAKVEPDRRTTAPDSRAHAVFCRRRHQPRSPPRHPRKREPFEHGSGLMSIRFHIPRRQTQSPPEPS